MTRAAGSTAATRKAASGVCVEHCYPAAFPFLVEHGPRGIAILHVLLTRAEERDGELVARASVRDIAGRLGSLSKDSVHRGLRQLARAGVIEAIDRMSGSAVAPSTYVVHLGNCGITFRTNDPA